METPSLFATSITGTKSPSPAIRAMCVTVCFPARSAASRPSSRSTQPASERMSALRLRERLPDADGLPEPETAGGASGHRQTDDIRRCACDRRVLVDRAGRAGRCSSRCGRRRRALASRRRQSDRPAPTAFQCPAGSEADETAGCTARQCIRRQRKPRVGPSTYQSEHEESRDVSAPAFFQLSLRAPRRPKSCECERSVDIDPSVVVRVVAVKPSGATG